MKNKRSVNQSVEALQRQYSKLVERLGKTSLILQGTITERTIVRADLKHPERNKICGPYYQWTFKEGGKTNTINLTASQAKVYQKAINQNRLMKKTLLRMQELSLRILEATTTGVKRRKSRSLKGIRLS